MNDRDRVAAERQGRLAEAIRNVKVAAAERDDVVVELREAAHMRLELLAQELEPVFAEVPAEEILFDFAISSGSQPRLWIDAVSHIAMGRDRRTYRFLRDTRLGRVVLAESTEIKPVADQVTRYIAERMVERQRWLDGTVEAARPSAPAEQRDRDAAVGKTPSRSGSPAVQSVHPTGEGGNGNSLLAYASQPESREEDAAEPGSEVGKARAIASAVGIVLFGAASGLAILAAVYWDEVAAYVAAY